MHTNPFQALLNDYHQDREKQEHLNFIEEEKRRHASHHLPGRGAEWRPFLVAPRRAAAGCASSSSSLRCWPATMTPATSASPRGLHLPVFSFDALHRPFCAPPATTTSWTPAPPSSTPWTSSSSSSSASWSILQPSRAQADVSAPPRPPRRGRLVLPALTDPEPAVRREEAANVVSSSNPTAVAAEESVDSALLSLVTLSCSTSPAASPVRQPSTRLLRAASAGETFAAELRKRRKKRKREDAADNDHDELTGGPPLEVDHGENEDAEMRRRVGVVVAGDRAHKRRRVERLMSVGQAHDGDEDDKEEPAAGRVIDGERPQEAQGTEDSDVEADHHENEADRSNGGAQDDVGSEAAGEDHYDERGLGVLMLGEESANEEEEDNDNDNGDELDALDESRRQHQHHQHQHQKTVMEMEMVTETTSPHPLPPAAGRRGPRRIWASISARELEGLRLYAPMPTGSRRTRVSRMGLHHFFHRAHPARGPSTLAS